MQLQKVKATSASGQKRNNENPLNQYKMVSNVYSLGVQIVFPLVSSRSLELSRSRQFCVS